jgi:histidinol dehydrogenase
MNIYQNHPKEDWSQLVERPTVDTSLLHKNVKAVLKDVKRKGDKAIKKYTKQFDNIELKDFYVTVKEMNEAIASLSENLKKAIQVAAENIRTFHSKQVHEPEIIQTMDGIQCWRKHSPIEKVGLYIPGGTAPLFSSILMLGIPAKIAGCKEIILCSPPDKKGKLHPAILFAAQLVGVTRVFKIGGVQAIAAMAYGTETVPKVHKIFGPGNQYVTHAKQLVQQDGVAIDMPAGPSEVCVLADETSNPTYVAADLLSQAEHGTDSQVILISISLDIVEDVMEEIQKQLKNLRRKKISIKALENSKAIVVHNIDEAIELANEYAPEHLIICCKDEETIAERIINAGSIFLGHYSPESVGDYASGTNHTLPTNGFAKMHSGVSVDSFVKKITYQKLTQQGLHNISNVVIQMAEAEGLDAHANAVRVRISN